MEWAKGDPRCFVDGGAILAAPPAVLTTEDLVGRLHVCVEWLETLPRGGRIPLDLPRTTRGLVPFLRFKRWAVLPFDRVTSGSSAEEFFNASRGYLELVPAGTQMDVRGVRFERLNGDGLGTLLVFALPLVRLRVEDLAAMPPGYNAWVAHGVASWHFRRGDEPADAEPSKVRWWSTVDVGPAAYPCPQDLSRSAWSPPVRGCACSSTTRAPSRGSVSWSRSWRDR